MIHRLSAALLLMVSVGWPSLLPAQEIPRGPSTQDPMEVGAEEAPEDSAEVEEEEKKRDPKFVVGFDVGVEILFTMMRLRDEGLPTDAYVAYAAEVDSVFGPFAAHPAVDAVGDLLSRGVRVETLLNTLLCHGPPPDFTKEFPYWTPDSSAAGTDGDDRARLLSAVRSFYRDTAFQEFWDIRWEKVKEAEDLQEPESFKSRPDTSELEEPRPLWTQGLEAVEDTLYVLLHAEMAREPYQMYYGSRGNATYRFVLTWQSPADTVLATRSAGRELLAWAVPVASDTLAILDRERLERQRALDLGIAVVEPLADWLWPYLAEYEFLFEHLMRGRGRLGLWNSWGECFVEHLRRAAETRILLATRGEDAAEAYLNAREEEGYGLLRILADKLAEYEMNRAQYLSLPDFCPRLISALEDVEVEVSSREPAFGADLEPVGSGLLITRIVEGLTADRADLAVGDTLAMVDGMPVGPETDLEALTRARGVGGRVEIVVLRKGRARKLTLLLGADLILYRFFRATGSSG